jgi:hypothetical protein
VKPLSAGWLGWIGRVALVGIALLGVSSWTNERVTAGTKLPSVAAPPIRLAVANSFYVAGMPVETMLNVRRTLRHGAFVWNEEGVPPGKISVRVELAAQTISVFRAGHEIGTAIILFGADSKPTPVGTYFVLEQREQHRSNLYDADMPYMMRLTNDGIALHGSDVRRGAATHGCIGLPLGFARRLFKAATLGMPVAIVADRSDILGPASERLS